MDRFQAFAKKRYSHGDAAVESGNPGASYECYHQNTKPVVDTKDVEDDDWVAINEGDQDEAEYDFCGCAEKD
ncbi:hypothetical protein AC579_7314 [Pseudocercospora musae]|uniref:Uncharacterized protein n=1 Tax=Pseudocercospora musae TaxID=113226 RepID=A0A139I195_9PEZI|nr:hypothetical protein AC579_7314 [Pseudocercospora musae]